MASIVQLAGMLPRDREFRAFVSQYLVPAHPASVDEAAQFIRTVCEIESRRELATDIAAADRFERFLRRPFTRWRERQEQHA